MGEKYKILCRLWLQAGENTVLFPRVAYTIFFSEPQFVFLTPFIERKPVQLHPAIILPEKEEFYNK